MRAYVRARNRKRWPGRGDIVRTAIPNVFASVFVQCAHACVLFGICKRVRASHIPHSSRPAVIIAAAGPIVCVHSLRATHSFSYVEAIALVRARARAHIEEISLKQFSICAECVCARVPNGGVRACVLACVCARVSQQTTFHWNLPDVVRGTYGRD